MYLVKGYSDGKQMIDVEYQFAGHSSFSLTQTLAIIRLNRLWCRSVCLHDLIRELRAYYSSSVAKISCYKLCLWLHDISLTLDSSQKRPVNSVSKVSSSFWSCADDSVTAVCRCLNCSTMKRIRSWIIVADLVCKDTGRDLSVDNVISGCNWHAFLQLRVTCREVGRPPDEERRSDSCGQLSDQICDDDVSVLCNVLSNALWSLLRSWWRISTWCYLSVTRQIL